MASRMGRTDRLVDINEFDIMQNYALSAHALREFVKFYQSNSVEKKGPELILCMPILPIALNKEASESIGRRFYSEGGLFKTLMENRILYTGLQSRMEKMYDQTMESLNFAFASGLLYYEQKTSKVIVRDSTDPSISFGDDYKKILSTARRLGTWFGKLEMEDVLMILQIRF